MMIYRLFPVLLLCLFCTAAYSQNASIRGSIIDKQSKEPLEFASVVLLSPTDSALIAGTVSKANGSFDFSKLNQGGYVLKIAFIGYQTLRLPIKFEGTRSLDLGPLEVSPGAELLSQVVVAGERVNSTQRIDKQSYRADQFESAKGGTAIDVLKNLPSVSVNGEGDISVRGSAGFLVLVNGKPVLTDAKTVLSQLPANSLESIELVTSPSAKYDPDGKGGIINIVTKKGANDGFTVAANASVGLPSTTDHGNKEKPKRFGGDLALNYRGANWDVAAGANYLRADVAGYREGDVFTRNFSNNTLTRFPSVGERSFDKYNWGGRFSAVYSPDKANTFSAGFFAGKRHQSRLADILYSNTRSNLINGNQISAFTYFNSNLQTKEANFLLANLDYQHTFENKSTLSTSLLYENAGLSGNTQNRNLSFPDLANTLQFVYNPYTNPINGYRFKLDYAFNLGKGKLESGYQFRYDTQDGQFDYEVTPATAQPDAARFRGGAKAKNQINSVYTQYSKKNEKWEYNAGLRYEYANREVNLTYDPVPHLLDLSNLFPSINLLHHVSPEWKLKAGYSKRIQRTNNFELNPIPEREHSETLEQGDPDLLPSFIDLTEAGFIHTAGKVSFFSTLYHQNIKNPIQRVNSVYADTILNRVFTNAGKARTIGLEAGTNIQATPGWSIYLGANLYNYKINGDLDILGVNSTVDNGAWVHSVNANTNVKLGTTWSMQANLNYLSRRPTAQGEDSRFLVPNTSLKKTWNNGRFTGTLQWQNMDLGILGSQQQRITTSGKDFYTTTNYIYETDVFMLNFSFNLNKLTTKAKTPASEFGEKEF